MTRRSIPERLLVCCFALAASSCIEELDPDAVEELAAELPELGVDPDDVEELLGSTGADDLTAPVDGQGTNYSYKVCFRQRVTGIYLADALVGSRFDLGKVPFLDPASPSRGDDYGWDSDQKWKARGRKFKIRQGSSSGSVVKSGWLSPSSGCVSFTRTTNSFTGHFKLWGETKLRGGTVLLRTGSSWGSPYGYTPSASDGGSVRTISPGTTYIDMWESDYNRLLTIASYVIESRLSSLTFGTTWSPHRIFVTKAANTCSPMPCAEYGGVAPGVSSIHIPGGSGTSTNARRKYVIAHELGHAIMTQRAARSWTAIGGLDSGDYDTDGTADNAWYNGSHSMFSWETPSKAAAEGWGNFIAAVAWNSTETNAGGKFSLWGSGCVPGPQQYSNSLCTGNDATDPYSSPGGYGASWNENFINVESGTSLCDYWGAEIGTCPSIVPGPTLPGGGVNPCGLVAVTGTEIDWMRHLWDYYTNSSASGGYQPALEEVAKIVESGLRNKTHDFDIAYRMRAAVPTSQLSRWDYLANFNDVDQYCF